MTLLFRSYFFNGLLAEVIRIIALSLNYKVTFNQVMLDQVNSPSFY